MTEQEKCHFCEEEKEEMQSLYVFDSVDGKHVSVQVRVCAECRLSMRPLFLRAKATPQTSEMRSETVVKFHFSFYFFASYQQIRNTAEAFYLCGISTLIENTHLYHVIQSSYVFALVERNTQYPNTR